MAVFSPYIIQYPEQKEKNQQVKVPVPGYRFVKVVIGEETKERGEGHCHMVYLRFFDSQFYSKGNFPGCLVVLYIPHIIDI